MKRKKTTIRRILEHETCRIRGHAWRPYQKAHFARIETGMWSALADEKGKVCDRCGMTSGVEVARR